MVGIEGNSIWSLFSLWPKLAMGQENALALTADNMLSKWDKQDTNERTAELCLHKIGQPFRKSCFIEKSVRYARPIG